MVTTDDIARFDPSGMHAVYDEWAGIARDSYLRGGGLGGVDLDGTDHIVFCGMGGSGAIGDVFSSILSQRDIHVSVVKGYRLPKTVDSETLVVSVSVSGNTVETIAATELADKTGCRMLTVSSGGELERLSQNRGIGHVRIPFMHSARTSFVSYLYSLLRILSDSLPVTRGEVEESLGALESLSARIRSANLDAATNPSLGLAEFIDRTPIIYYPNGLSSTATRFKNSLQENAKTHVMTEEILESTHNNIVCWERPSDLSVVLLSGPDDDPKTVERWDILRDYFSENGVGYREVHAVSGNILTKLVYLTYLLDYASVYLAIRRQTDPSPVRSIDYVKRRLGDGGR